MKLRLWARQSPHSHVAATAGVTALLLVLLVAAVVPASSDDTALATGSGGFDLAPTTSESAGDTSATETPAATSADPTGAQSASPKDANPQPATPNDATAQSAPANDQPPSSAQQPTPEAPTETGAAAPTTVARTASDQGVTEDTIKVGFLIPDIAGLGQAGAAATSSRTDLPEVVAAYVDHVNNNGGVASRTVTHVTVESDPVNSSSQRAACIRLADDEKVFAAFDSASTLGVAQNCYAEKGVILTTTASQTNSEQNFLRNGGLLASSGASMNRILLNWTDLAMDAGFVGPDKGKLGILSTECAPDPEAIDGDFKPYLDELGIEYLDVRLSCDLAAAQQQVSGAVLQFRQAGVDRVLPSAIFVTVNNFLQAAEAQQYRPTYFCSDMWGMCLDIFTENFPDSQWDGTRGFTFSHSGEDKAGKPLSPAVQRCSKILTDAGLPGVEEQMGRDAGAVALCDSFFLWVTAMRNAPPNPKRADFPNAIAAVGDTWESAYAGRAVFRPGKFNGGDDYAPVQWAGGCSCYTQTGPRTAAVR